MGVDSVDEVISTFVKKDKRLIVSGVADEYKNIQWSVESSKRIHLTWAGLGYHQILLSSGYYIRWCFCGDSAKGNSLRQQYEMCIENFKKLLAIESKCVRALNESSFSGSRMNSALSGAIGDVFFGSLYDFRRTLSFYYMIRQQDLVSHETARSLLRLFKLFSLELREFSKTYLPEFPEEWGVSESYLDGDIENLDSKITDIRRHNARLPPALDEQ